MTAGAIALVAFACAFMPCAALAQASANPADVLAPSERETFTFTFRSASPATTNGWTFNEMPALELNAGQKWRFTFNLQQDPERFEFDSMSAGAFFNLTPRMRLGGALSLNGENDALSRASNGQLDGDVPEVKFESAFKF